ncbi:kinesin-like protein Klp98A [Linepithema humile]|uniref:kinesin-like protein Klp98A n=1 Tax=Linepithema humile TaxID=83485 RepID=UPI00351EFEA9
MLMRYALCKSLCSGHMALVKVTGRVRPFNKRKVAMNEKLIVQMDGKRTRIFNTKTPDSCRDIDRGKYKDFTFDHSYWSFDPKDNNYASQEEVKIADGRISGQRSRRIVFLFIW